MDDLVGVQILAVDDESSLLLLVEKILSKLGARVHLAQDRDGALDVLASERIDVLFCDHQLGRYTSDDWLDDCRRRYPHLKILVTSGEARPTRPQLAFLPKPYSSASLRQALQELLKQA